jgi:hypothetical protein
MEQEYWDAELDRDASAGKLDFLIAEAREDRRLGRESSGPDKSVGAAVLHRS